jgi:hypothetical protein
MSVSRKLSVLGRVAVIGVAVSAAFLGACASDPGPEDVAGTGDLDLVGQRDAKWSTTSIPVCWTALSGSGAVEQSLMQLAMSEFSKVGICFKGWKRCDASTPKPAIRIAVDTEHASAGAAGWSYVGPVTWNYTPSEPTLWLHPNYAKSSLIHELGHAIGFHHEHEREDNQNECWANETSLKKSDGSLVFLTPYDRNSVMNYCGQDTLSSQDIQGMRAFYGTTAVTCGGGTGGGTGGTTPPPPVTDLHGKVFRLKAVHSGKCVDVYNGVTGAAYIKQWGCHEGLNQRFRFIKQTDGTYQLQAAHTTNMCVRAMRDANGRYTDGAAIYQQQCVSTFYSVRWTVKQLGNNLVQFVNAKSGKCMDVASVSKADNANIYQWGCHTGDNQKFLLEPR